MIKTASVRKWTSKQKTKTNEKQKKENCRLPSRSPPPVPYWHPTRHWRVAGSSPGVVPLPPCLLRPPPHRVQVSECQDQDQKVTKWSSCIFSLKFTIMHQPRLNAQPPQVQSAMNEACAGALGYVTPPLHTLANGPPLLYPLLASPQPPVRTFLLLLGPPSLMALCLLCP